MHVLLEKEDVTTVYKREYRKGGKVYEYGRVEIDITDERLRDYIGKRVKYKVIIYVDE